MKNLLIAGGFFLTSLTVFTLLNTSTEYRNWHPDSLVSSTPDYTSVPLATQVGQLFAVGHWPNIEASTTAARVRDLQLGSVIVMAAPENESDITVWTASWQAAAASPLLISIDQEGGVVSRLRDDRHVQTAQPDITSQDKAYSVASERATALSTLGINANYAPVLDQSTSRDSFMYQRVFRDPATAAALGDAMVRGYAANDIIAVTKHYPGHPDTSDDSHITLPVLDMDVTEYIVHTQPFTDLIKLGDTEMLMTAHVLVPALDPNYPATVSAAVIGDLRDRIGYDGVVITDDLAMQAISDQWDYAEAAVMALAAGADMIMIAAEPENASSTIAAVIEAVEQGDLARERVFEAYNRVMRVKNAL